MTRFISFSTVLSHVKTMGDNVLLSAVAPDIPLRISPPPMGIEPLAQ